MDGRTAARFPFLRSASEYVGDVDLYEVLTEDRYAKVRERGLDRVLGAIKDHKISDVPLIAMPGMDNDPVTVEILSYPYARIIVSCVDDRLLTKRYALAEAERMNELLGVEKSAIPLVCEELEVKGRQAEKGYRWMHFADFLRYSYVMRAVEWKLINMDIKAGYVHLPEDKFTRLLQNAYRLRIESELPMNIPKDIREAVKDAVGLTRMQLDEMKVRMSPTGGQAVRNEHLPPCIQTIISMAASGQNLSHSARFTLVSYLHALGMDYSQVVGVFAESPDFDESISEYQIKHIMGELNGSEGYTPPTCEKMKTYGICFSPDNLCEKINHPLNYYRIKAGIRGDGGNQS